MRGKMSYLRRQEVDVVKWDACITNAANGLVYGYSYYLDAMTTDWDALVLDDYAAVMPLPWRKKWGITYLYHPFLTAQLGVFGNQLTAEVVSGFLQAVPKKFRLWDFSLNHGNLFATPGFPLYQRKNFVLSLRPDYDVVYKAYRENIRRNIKRSTVYGCRVTTGVPIEKLFELTRFHTATVPRQDEQNFIRLFEQMSANGLAKTYGVLSQKDELLSAAAFLFSHNRAYYILVGNHPNGRTLGASHALIDAFIRDHAGQNLLLDFEGSDLRNLAFFYSSFGAAEENYAAIKLNLLPWWTSPLIRLQQSWRGGPSPTG